MPERRTTPQVIQLSADARIAFGCGAKEIYYRGDDTCPYGRQATTNREPFAAVVLHHNPPHRSLNWLIEYQIQGDVNRGGHFGYHFYVSRNGQIFQGAPLTMRTNHIKGLGYMVRKEFGRIAQNRNSIGITCVGAERPFGFAPSYPQSESTISLVQAVCSTFNISFTNVFGHGEIQSDRHPMEGASIAEFVRNWALG